MRLRSGGGGAALGCVPRLLFVTLLGCSGAIRPADGTDPPPPIVVERDVVYASRPDGDLRADIYRPSGPGPHPAVLVVHAGSWRRGSKGDMVHIATRLADGGFVAVSIDYRLAPEHRFPAALDDCREAVRWMRARSGALDLDPTRVGGFGYSAGGHLVALLATTADAGGAARLQAAVAGGAPTDLRRFGLSPAVRGFIGGAPDALPEAYADASPITHVSPDDPPMLLYHGRSDWLVDIVQATTMRDALRGAGVPVAYYETPYGHFSTFFFDAEPLGAALGFLDVWLGQPATAQTPVVSPFARAATQGGPDPSSVALAVPQTGNSNP